MLLKSTLKFTGINEACLFVAMMEFHTATAVERLWSLDLNYMDDEDEDSRCLDIEIKHDIKSHVSKSKTIGE